MKMLNINRTLGLKRWSVWKVRGEYDVRSERSRYVTKNSPVSSPWPRAIRATCIRATWAIGETNGELRMKTRDCLADSRDEHAVLEYVYSILWVSRARTIFQFSTFYCPHQKNREARTSWSLQKRRKSNLCCNGCSRGTDTACLQTGRKQSRSLGVVDHKLQHYRRTLT